MVEKENNLDNKTQIISALREEFARWEDFLANLGESEIISADLPGNLSIKDVVAHLRAWQQVSIARLEAAQQNCDPLLPGWLHGLDPDLENYTDQFNSWIYQDYQNKDWSSVHSEWKIGYSRFLELSESTSEENMLVPGKFPWLKGYPLIAVLQGSFEHHHIDHLLPLLALFQQDDQPGLSK